MYIIIENSINIKKNLENIDISHFELLYVDA